MICELNPIVGSIRGLQDLAGEGRKVSFTLYRTKGLSSRAAKAYLGGSDPKLTLPICDVCITPFGYRIFWKSKFPAPTKWKSLVSEQDFEKGLSQLSHFLLTIGNLSIQ